MPTTSQYSLLNHYFTKSKKGGIHTTSFSQLKKGIVTSKRPTIHQMKEEVFSSKISLEGSGNNGGSQSHREYGIGSCKEAQYKQAMVGNFDFTSEH